MTIGLYIITNKINGNMYVGSSGNIENRWYNHKSNLNKGNHHNSHLQYAWNKYGGDNFDFNILAITDKREDALALEDYILKNYINLFEYNIAVDVNKPTLGWHPSEETKRKMCAAQSGENNPSFGKSPSIETRNKISNSLTGENNPNFGKQHKPETIAKIREAHIGMRPSDETRKKISDNHADVSGKNHPRWIDIPDEIINSMRDLKEKGYTYQSIADQFGFNRNLICRRLAEPKK